MVEYVSMKNTDRHVLEHVNVDFGLHKGQISRRQLQSCSVASVWVVQFRGMVDLGWINLGVECGSFRRRMQWLDSSECSSAQVNVVTIGSEDGYGPLKACGYGIDRGR